MTPEEKILAIEFQQALIARLEDIGTAEEVKNARAVLDAACEQWGYEEVEIKGLLI